MQNNFKANSKYLSTSLSLCYSEKVILQDFKPTNSQYLGEKKPFIALINFPRTAASLVPLSGSLTQLQRKVYAGEIQHLSTEHLLRACTNIKRINYYKH
jgi:hypothetical protein